MRIILEFNEFILESGKIYKTQGDPYEYKVVNKPSLIMTNRPNQLKSYLK